jgi:hypothetical protein
MPSMTPYRMPALPAPGEPDADVTRFAARVRRGRSLQRAVGLAVLALLCFGAIIPLAAPAVRVAGDGAPPSTPAPWGRRGRRLPVQASVLWPGMCGPDQYMSQETQFALAVAGFERCPWF